jgi:hypothetical protein
MFHFHGSFDRMASFSTGKKRKTLANIGVVHSSHSNEASLAKSVTDSANTNIREQHDEKNNSTCKHLRFCRRNDGFRR